MIGVGFGLLHRRGIQVRLEGYRGFGLGLVGLGMGGTISSCVQMNSVNLPLVHRELFLGFLKREIDGFCYGMEGKRRRISRFIEKESKESFSIF